MSKITSSSLNITDEYEFYNRTEQYNDVYLEYKHTVYKHGLCGDLQTPPMKRPCTPFLHIHPYQTEKFFLLQGYLSYQMDDKIYSCTIDTCPTPIIIPPNVPHSLWMNDNQEDLIFIVRVEPIYKHHGLQAAGFENVAGVRRDKYMTLWQAFVLIDSIESYPTVLPLTYVKFIVKIGSFIGQILGYQSEYEEYTTKF